MLLRKGQTCAVQRAENRPPAFRAQIKRQEICRRHDLPPVSCLSFLEYHLTVARTRVKICGICRPHDAAEAARAGADAIGIVFDPTARRCVSPTRRRRNRRRRAPVCDPVALFVNAPADKISAFLASFHLAQFNCTATNRRNLIADLKPIRVVKALHLTAGDTH